MGGDRDFVNFVFRNYLKLITKPPHELRSSFDLDNHFARHSQRNLFIKKIYWAHLVEHDFEIDVSGFFNNEPLGKNILVLHVNFNLVGSTFLNVAKLGIYRGYLNSDDKITSMSLWSLSFRSACTIMVRFSRRVL